MPLDPMIARGVQAPNPSNALIAAAEIGNRSQYNALLGQQQQFNQQRAQDTDAKAQEEQELRMLYPLVRAGDPMAIQQALGSIAQRNPEIAQAFSANPQLLTQALEQGLGIKPEGLSGKGMEPFTLSPGSKRYAVNPDGTIREVAGVPFAPPNQTVIQLPTGQAVFNPRTAAVTPLSSREDQRAAEVADVSAVESAKATASKSAELAASVEKKIGETRNVNDALDLATPLILAATGSYGGAVADKLVNVFGGTLSGDEAISALKVLQAKVMLSQPRMEGPQSDRDVQLYREAAGELGDPTVTRAKKQAAVRTIRELNNRYAARNSGNTPAPAQPQGGLTPDEQAELDALREWAKGR